MQYPDRIPTGIGRQTVEFPKDSYCGPAEGYDFRRQKPQYEALKEALASLGMEISVVGVRDVTPTRSRFVVIVGDPENPRLIWEKYESPNSSAAGQNRIYVNGQVVKMTTFAHAKLERRQEIIEPCELRRMVATY